MDDRQKELARYRLYRAELELETAKEAFRTGNYFWTLRKASKKAGGAIHG